jgi:hypothetical protein
MKRIAPIAGMKRIARIAGLLAIAASVALSAALCSHFPYYGPQTSALVSA